MNPAPIQPLASSRARECQLVPNVLVIALRFYKRRFRVASCYDITSLVHGGVYKKVVSCYVVLPMRESRFFENWGKRGTRRTK